MAGQPARRGGGARVSCGPARVPPGRRAGHGGARLAGEHAAVGQPGRLVLPVGRSAGPRASRGERPRRARADDASRRCNAKPYQGLW